MVEEKKKSPSSGQPGGETMGRKGTNLPTDSSIQQTPGKCDAKKVAGFEHITSTFEKSKYVKYVPCDLLRDNTIGGLAHQILCHLLTDSPSGFTPSIAGFCKIFHRKPTAVKEAIRKLKEAGYLYIDIHPKGVHGSKWYFFDNPQDNHFSRGKPEARPP